MVRKTIKLITPHRRESRNLWCSLILSYTMSFAIFVLLESRSICQFQFGTITTVTWAIKYFTSVKINYPELVFGLRHKKGFSLLGIDSSVELKCGCLKIVTMLTKKTPLAHSRFIFFILFGAIRIVSSPLENYKIIPSPLRKSFQKCMWTRGCNTLRLKTAESSDDWC